MDKESDWFANIPDWPVSITKPEIPTGCAWVCLRPAIGIGKAPNHPWYIRATYPTKRYSRMIKTPKDYYETPEQAIDAAMKVLKEKCK